MAAVVEQTVSDLKQTLKALNLTEAEYGMIVEGMGREPNFNELGMFSVLWSEHCCYKNSRHLLKRLPTQGERILQGPGENAGVVAIDDEISVAFKIESHNHPTAVEPFQGATTGVGGILRDIFTMNARPVANLNALRFGPLTDSHNHFLFTHAVEGIAHYGNCVGVPTLAGEVFFDESYSGNPLVNAMALGILYRGELMASGAKGVGNPVLYVGSDTGKDGMGGAAFASRELDESSNEDRPAVQVGDPFSEKLLIESCLEAFASGLIVSAQDMGAAGLTCSGAEMSAKGNLGMRIDLDKVPAREPGMQAWEYLLSESQERMLMVVEKGREADVMAIFDKWGVPSVIVGEVIAEERLEFYHHGEKVVDVPAKLLTDEAPSYPRGDNPPEPTIYQQRRQRLPQDETTDITEADIAPWLEKLFASSNIARPTGVYQQYDRHVRNNTLLASDNNGSGVIRLRRKNGEFSGQAVAMTTDCNSRYVYLNPKSGAISAVAEACRNLACVGAEPLAVTDNLNFGNPEKPEIYYQLYWAVEGIREACEAFETPVTGGNVSLYNEHSGAPIMPAPVIGMVGLLNDSEKTLSPRFKQAGHQVALMGVFAPTIAGSEFQKLSTGEVYGEPPAISLESEKALIQALLQLNNESLLQSAQDISMGGLLVTLVESTFSLSETQAPLGVSVDLSALQAGRRLDTTLFGETNGSAIISYRPENLEQIRSICKAAGVDCLPIGEVTNSPSLSLSGNTIDLNAAQNAWRTGLVFTH